MAEAASIVETDALRIESVEELRVLFGEPGGLAVKKCIRHIDPHARAFIEKSPFLCLSTADAAGRADVTPRGDPAGFVHVLDEHTIAGDSLCFADLSIRHAFVAAATTRYTLSFYDYGGRPLGRTVTVAARDGGETCAALALATSHAGYTIVRIDTARPGFTGTTYVHVARDVWAHEPTVIGIWRP